MNESEEDVGVLMWIYSGRDFLSQRGRYCLEYILLLRSDDRYDDHAQQASRVYVKGDSFSFFMIRFQCCLNGSHELCAQFGNFFESLKYIRQ